MFFDDILIYSRNEAEHIEHVGLVLATLEKHQLFANYKKCEFGKREVAYLGYVVSGEGVSADMGKVKAMLDWPQPKNIRELRGFLGLTGYYRKFVAGYAQVAQPLTEQLKSEKFCWSMAATEAFNSLKQK